HRSPHSPLACAAAIASIGLFEKEKTVEGVRKKENILLPWLEAVRGLEHVGDARGLGLMAGVELVRDSNSRPHLTIIQSQNSCQDNFLAKITLKMLWP
ncbi:MAG: hypothetical protein DSY83_15480, partial [Flavobacteriia bacterium]